MGIALCFINKIEYILMILFDFIILFVLFVDLFVS